MEEFFELLKHFDFRGLFIKPTENGFLQFFRYAFVGGIATIIDWGVLFLLTQLGIYYLISAVFSFFAGLIVNFILSKLFVFSASKARIGKTGEFISYGLIGAIGLLLTMGIMYVLTDLLNIHYMLSKIIATAIVLAWNYIARKKTLYQNTTNV